MKTNFRFITAKVQGTAIDGTSGAAAWFALLKTTSNDPTS